jgi:hypothetical protein
VQPGVHACHMDRYLGRPSERQLPGNDTAGKVADECGNQGPLREKLPEPGSLSWPSKVWAKIVSA